MHRPTIAVLCASALTFAASGASAQEFIRMVAGPTGGSWYPLGAKVVEIFEREIDGIATSNSPGGGMGNVREVGAKDAEMGWTFAHTAEEGYTGTEPFDSEYPDVRHFATLYQGVLHAVVPRASQIESYEDIAGHSISPGQQFVAGTTVVNKVLNAYGITYDEVEQLGGTVHHVSFDDSVSMMKDGHIDVYFAIVEAPHSSVIELNFSPGIRLLSIDEPVLEQLLEENAAYDRVVIPAGTYEGIDEDVVTIGVAAAIIVHKDVPEDIVYQMCNAFWDHRDEIAQVADIWERVRPEDALRGAGIPVHPGAERCYEERGIGAG